VIFIRSSIKSITKAFHDQGNFCDRIKQRENIQVLTNSGKEKCNNRSQLGRGTGENAANVSRRSKQREDSFTWTLY